MKLLIGLLCLTSSAQTLQDYMTGLSANSTAIVNTVGSTPQPRINLSFQHIPGNLNYLDNSAPGCDPSASNYLATGACHWNNATILNAYTDALKAHGAGSIDINLDMEPLKCAAQYSGSLTCGTLPNWFSKTLLNYDSMIAHAVAVGVKVRFAPTPNASIIAACGLTGSSVEADVENCFKPLYVAAASRWGTSINSFTVVHEIVGAWSVITAPLSVSDWRAFITNTSAAIKTVQCLILTGAAAETMFAGDATYWADWIINIATMGIDFLGVDLYPSTWAIGSYRSTVLVTAANWAAQARGVNKEIRINETNRPPYVLSPAQATDPNAVIGGGSCTWVNNGADDIFFASMIPWASAHQYSSISLFGSGILMYCSNDPVNSYFQSGTYSLDMLAHLTETTQTGTLYALFVQPDASMQGPASLTGKAKIGR